MFSEKYRVQAANAATPLVFDPTLEYPKEQVVLCWQLLSYLSQWSPSSCAVEEVSFLLRGAVYDGRNGLVFPGLPRNRD